MARNQVAPERPIKRNNNFVGKPEKKFKVKFNSKPLPKDESKPSSTSPGNFFVRPKDNQRRQDGVAEDLDKKNMQQFTFEKATKSPKYSNKKNAGQHQNLEAVSNKSKKPFDKKKYRLQKYSKKYKLQQWEDRRKKAVLREYYRSVKDDDGPKLDINKIYKEDSEVEEDKVHEENENNLNTNIVEEKSEVFPESDESPRGKSKKPKYFKKAMEEFERIKNEKQYKKEEYLRKKVEREEAIKKSKKEKALMHKKIARSTKKGQPVMKDRLEMLLERIQKSMN